MTLTVVVNLVAVLGLLKEKETRARLIGGLLKLCADQQVDGYYDPALLRSYGARYYSFILAVVCMGAVAIVVPLVLRCVEWWESGQPKRSFGLWLGAGSTGHARAMPEMDGPTCLQESTQAG